MTFSGGDPNALDNLAPNIKNLRGDYEGANSDIMSALADAAGAAGDPAVADAIGAVKDRVFFSLSHLPEVISVTGSIVEQNSSLLRTATGS